MFLISLFIVLVALFISVLLSKSSRPIPFGEQFYRKLSSFQDDHPDKAAPHELREAK